MMRIAVLDDWQGVAKSSADWSPLMARAEVHFFREPFAGEDGAAGALADFDIVLCTANERRSRARSSAGCPGSRCSGSPERARR